MKQKKTNKKKAIVISFVILFCALLLAGGIYFRIDEIIRAGLTAEEESTEDLSAVEPELKKASVRKYVMEIRKALSRIGFEGTLRHTRDSYSVHPDRLDCDYYRFLEGDPSAVKLYNGEYMSQYGWAEPTIAMLESMRQDVST